MKVLDFITGKNLRKKQLLWKVMHNFHYLVLFFFHSFFYNNNIKHIINNNKNNELIQPVNEHYTYAQCQTYLSVFRRKAQHVN